MDHVSVVSFNKIYSNEPYHIIDSLNRNIDIELIVVVIISRYKMVHYDTQCLFKIFTCLARNHCNSYLAIVRLCWNMAKSHCSPLNIIRHIGAYNQLVIYWQVLQLCTHMYEDVYINILYSLYPNLFGLLSIACHPCLNQLVYFP